MRQVTPLQCRLRKVELHVIRIQDEGGREWISRLYLGQDSQALEDAGRRPSQFQVEAVFLGPTWRYDLLQLREAVEESHADASAFVHPFWGTIYGEVTAFAVTHVDQEHDSAQVRFTFAEGDVAGVTFDASATLPTAIAAAEAALDQADAALAALGAS